MTTSVDAASAPAPLSPEDPELDRIVEEEERCLHKVLTHLDARPASPPPEDKPRSTYDEDLLSLRDQMATARSEDLPPLLEQMARLQSLAARRREPTEVAVDARSPYFGRLVLEEGGKRREVLIGRGTSLDTRAGVRIVDWRDAPVSRLYYRYEEGDEYDEVFGDREVTGQVLTRRSLGIQERRLRRIGCPQGAFARNATGAWRRLDQGSTQLRGGAGSATRAEQHHRAGKLGVSGAEEREDKHLKEITALIDPRQFELITATDSGLVVIQGGAGSGKTTIGLHRLAYLAFADPRRFRPEKMLVMVFNDALARYVSLVLPALEVPEVPIRTYAAWASRLRTTHVLRLPREYHDDTPPEVTRLKKSPAMLVAIEQLVQRLEAKLFQQLERAAAKEEPSARALLAAAWQRSEGRPVLQRLSALEAWLADGGQALGGGARLHLSAVIERARRDTKDVTSHWAELLSDGPTLWEAFRSHERSGFTPEEFRRAQQQAAERIGAVLADLERRADAARERQDERAAQGEEEARDGARRGRAVEPEGSTEDAASEEEDALYSTGVDGQEVEESAKLDPEDDALLLRLVQRLRSPLLQSSRGGRAKELLQYDHILVDEAQDMSPVELAVLLDTAGPAKSITLAGDAAQRLHLDNGFTSWSALLGDLGLSHVEVEPLKLSYRSTAEIVEFSRSVLGPLAPEEAPEATRHGAPVELFGFSHAGDAVAFLAEALRDLLLEEPSASVCVIARYPEQADAFYVGLAKGEVPSLRRVADQDFPFKAGVDVTDVRQVKGLEFDYVVLTDVNDTSYPDTAEARHLLHIGGTRAAHQLWLMTTGRPSALLPAELVERSS